MRAKRLRQASIRPRSVQMAEMVNNEASAVVQLGTRGMRAAEYEII